MAYDVTSDGPRSIENIGSFFPGKAGVAAIGGGGTVTVTVPAMLLIRGVFLSPQSANAAYVSAIFGNTFTITGTGGDNVMWFAIGKLRT